MREKNRVENQTWVWGCGLAALLIAAALGAVTGLALNQDHRAAQYPGAVLISSHSNYSSLPTHYRWDNAYQTTDSFTAVYNWYSTRFRLGAEARALGGCILLEGTNRRLTVERRMSVLLCDTPTDRKIYVTRSTSLR
ncbi:MAG: hypothetical protein ACE5G8_00825 [Anaerolineae bacterium]